MNKKTYLICAVRNATGDQLEQQIRIVRELEAQGFEVHFPPRDVDQSNDDGGVRICYEHREALRECDHVHVVWDNASTGSHFDLGMAYMLSAFKEVKFISPLPISKVESKSFQNVLFNLICLSHASIPHEDPRPVDLERDSESRFLTVLDEIAKEDAAGLKKAAQSYGPSWKRRGGVGAFMMLARKWDRMEERLKKLGSRMYDIFYGIATDDRGEGLIDDVRDLRRYLMLVEAEMRARGFRRGHRDNTPEPEQNAAEVLPKLADKKPIFRHPSKASVDCTCGASMDPGSCGHTSGCPRKKIEG